MFQKKTLAVMEGSIASFTTQFFRFLFHVVVRDHRAIVHRQAQMVRFAFVRNAGAIEDVGILLKQFPHMPEGGASVDQAIPSHRGRRHFLL